MGFSRVFFENVKKNCFSTFFWHKAYVLTLGKLSFLRAEIANSSAWSFKELDHTLSNKPKLERA